MGLVYGGSGHGQNLFFFWVFRVIMLIFLIFRAEAYTCWSARFARSRVGGVARLFEEIRFFSDSGIFSVFQFFGHLSQLWLFIMKGRLFIMNK